MQQHQQLSDDREDAEEEEETEEGSGIDAQKQLAQGSAAGAASQSALSGLHAERAVSAEAEGSGGEVSEGSGVDGASSSSSSTPKSSSGPSSVASTAVSSSVPSPSTLSAHATPFSSSFSSPTTSPPFFHPLPSSSHAPFFPSIKSHFPPPFYPKQHFPQSSASAAYFHSSPPPPSFSPFALAHPQLPHVHQPHAPSSSSSPPSPLIARDVEQSQVDEEVPGGDASSAAINFDRYDAIEVDVQGVELPPPISAFDDLSFPPTLQHNIHLARFAKPTPVQKHALPIALQGRDIMACAQTGSGKCWARGTRLRMYSGELKEVERIEGGELLMGDDGLPRKVTPGSLTVGRAELFRIQPQWEGAQPFTVNGEHILVLAVDAQPLVVHESDGRWAVQSFAVSDAVGLHLRSLTFHSSAAAAKEATRQMAEDQHLELELSVREFLNLPSTLQGACQLMACKAVTFQSDLSTLSELLSSIIGQPPSTTQLHMAAWYLGLRLALSHSGSDESNSEAWKLSQVGLEQRLAKFRQQLLPGHLRSSRASSCISPTSNAHSGCEDVECVGCRLLMAYGLLDGVQCSTAAAAAAAAVVPHGWLFESVAVRRHLLAGFIDGCGEVDGRGQCALTAVDRAVLVGYKDIAASLGVRNGAVHFSLHSSPPLTPLSAHRRGAGFRLLLSGDVWESLQLCACVVSGPLPAGDERARRSSRCYGFSVQSAGVSEYFGFGVHGGANRRLLLEDWTVTHNTAAFLFPLISMLLHSGLGAGPISGILGYGKQRRYAPSGLILAPTRELASQIHEEAVKFCSGSSLHAVVVYGGQDIRHQFRELDRGCDILVATPGRLMDFLERGRISLSQVGYLVFDEADRMLDMGFEPQIRQIVQGHDLHEARQTLMFSATFPREIQRLAADFLYNWAFIAVGRVGSSSDCIVQQVEYVEEEDKQQALVRLLPHCRGLTLIFVERKRTADTLESFLSRQRLSVTSIHGDRSQMERETALAHFRASRCPILVATDVAARGLDIPHVLDVINYDMPSTIEDYVHRIGRTGRCGRSGTATSFINRSSQRVICELHDMLVENKQHIPVWLEEWWRESRAGAGGRGERGRGRGGWGARDFRQGQFGSRGGSRGNRGFAFGRGGGRGMGGPGIAMAMGMAMGMPHGMGVEQGMGMSFNDAHTGMGASMMNSNGLMMMGAGLGGRGGSIMTEGAARGWHGTPPLGFGGGGGGAPPAPGPRSFAFTPPHEAWASSNG